MYFDCKFFCRTQWVNKKEEFFFLWILGTISNAIDVLTILS